MFVGLPGNPVATMVCFLLFARPVLLRLAGARLAHARGHAGAGRFRLDQAARAAASICAAASGATPTARLVAHRIEREGSGILTSMVEAGGLIELDDAVERRRARAIRCRS